MVVAVAAPFEFGNGDAKRTVAPPLLPLPMRAGRMSNETIMGERKDVEKADFKFLTKPVQRLVPHDLTIEMDLVGEHE
jgi:hypothetical protein